MKRPKLEARKYEGLEIARQIALSKLGYLTDALATIRAEEAKRKKRRAPSLFRPTFRHRALKAEARVRELEAENARLRSERR